MECFYHIAGMEVHPRGNRKPVAVIFTEENACQEHKRKGAHPSKNMLQIIRGWIPRCPQRSVLRVCWRHTRNTDMFGSSSTSIMPLISKQQRAYTQLDIIVD